LKLEAYLVEMFRYLLCASAVSAAHLYGFIDAFINKETQTAYQLVDIDTKSGAVTELLQTFVFNGGSASIDGIACYNRKSSTYFWANDGATSFIYSVLTASKSILPTFDSGATAVNSLACNQANGDLWVSWFEQETSTTTVSSKTTQKTGFGITQFKSTWEMGLTITPPAAANMDIVSGIAISGTHLYFLGSTTTNNISNPESYVWTFDARTGAQISAQPISCPILIESVAVASPTSLRGGAVIITPAEEEINVAYTVNPLTGLCTYFALSTPAIFTASSYNPTHQELYFAAAENNGAQLVTYSYATNKTSAVNTPDVFLNIQYSQE
jgi:hypothetical protein